MILFDLKCAADGHVFEAWFASSLAYDDQHKRGLLMCPQCGGADVGKALMAPNIPSKGNQKPSNSIANVMTSSAEPAAKLKALMAEMASEQAKSLKNSKWVGKDFERQARAMDAGEIDHGSIHGQATPEQAKAMFEDGLAVMPLLVPVIPPEEQN
jgi:hypothetical protein